jgi:predicted enzyme related to lactoylglutathione lyase
MTASRLVHLELHTPDQVQASAFYARLLHWRPELVRTASRSYLALELGPDIGGGIVECGTRRPLWLPYVEVGAVDEATEHARCLGATVVLEPSEGPSGRRCIVATPEAGEVALWERRR